MVLPLQGVVVLEFSQYLSGPSAGLRLADLGARVIKIERPEGGDPSRKLAIKNLWIGDDALNFHTINRNKESFTANLKDKDDFELVKKLIQKADVITHNFRPGVMERMGLSYEDVKKINEKIIYAEITGYGKEGPWSMKPGQDLLIQSISGLTYTTGNSDDDPMPFGLSVIDSICGIHAVQGILAALISRQKTGKGAYVELSLLESAIALQFELFTTWFLDNNSVKRSKVSNGNPLLGAPYGIYETKDGYIALAMMNIQTLRRALECAELDQFDQGDVFQKRDEIKAIIRDVLKHHTTDHWLSLLHKHHLWAAEVKDWKQLSQHEGYKVLGMEQEIRLQDHSIITTRCPIRIDGEKLYVNKPAPALGKDTEKIKNELV